MDIFQVFSCLSSAATICSSWHFVAKTWFPRCNFVCNIANTSRTCFVYRKPPKFRVDLFGQLLVGKFMFVAYTFSGKTQNILHWIFGPCGQPKKVSVCVCVCAAHLLDGLFQLLVCKTSHVSPGTKNLRS